MTLKAAFQSFLRESQFRTGQPASESDLREVESKLGFSLPETLRSCYCICNGGQAQDGRSNLELLSLNKALAYVPSFFESFWGYFAFAENNDSNPVCVCCKSPLAGYVVVVNHDDAARLMFRSPEGFFRSAVEGVEDGEFLHTHDLVSDFSGPERTEKDLAIARQLIDLAAKEETLGDQDRMEALMFACDLLADNNIAEMAYLLQIDDEYVREHVARRLKGIEDDNAKTVLRQFEEDLDAFVERCAQKLQREAIEASVHALYGKKTIRIDPGPIWLNMEALYAWRKRPDFDEYLLERARFFIADARARRPGG